MQKNVCSLILVIFLILGGISFCQVSGETVSTKIITDMGGNDVTVPADVQRIIITCYGGATQEVAVMDGESKVIAQPPQSFPDFLKMYPDLTNVPRCGEIR